MDGPVRPGVLPSQWLRKAYELGVITGTLPISDAQFQPASLDLRLGATAHRLRCSFLPGASHTVEERLPQFTLGSPIPLVDGAILERDRPYLIPLAESLTLPAEILGRANPKSSTGRLDIFTRLVTDRSTHFDDVAPGYTGPLYLEVVSRSFTIRVESGLTLNQLRLSNREATALSEQRLRRIHKLDPLLMRAGRSISAERLPVGGGGLFLSLDLADRRRAPVGWRAKKNSSLLDLTRLGAHDPHEFWEPVIPERGGGVILDPEEFYLLLSTEGVRIPPSYAAEMTAFDPTSGELRTHYAGFFDPGFGHGAEGYGSRAALEVRAHDVPFKVENGQRICKLVFFGMAEEPADLYGLEGSNYQFQNETLSKHFVRTKRRRVVARQPVQSPEPPPRPLF